MRSYELMLVLHVGQFTEDEKTLKPLVTKLLQGQELSDLEISIWGKRTLAYEIKKQLEGLYVLVTFKARAVSMSKIDQQIKLQEGILRHLLTKKEELK